MWSVTACNPCWCYRQSMPCNPCWCHSLFTWCNSHWCYTVCQRMLVYWNQVHINRAKTIPFVHSLIHPLILKWESAHVIINLKVPRKRVQGRVARQHPSRFIARGRKSASLVQLSPDALTVPDWVTTSAVQPTFWDTDSFNFKLNGRQYVPDWATTSSMQPTFWDTDSFNLKYHGRQLAPNRYAQP